MKKFTVLTSRVVPLSMVDVDTDQIMPARFLKQTKREEYAKNLFRDWRYEKNGSLKKDFILNNSIFSGKILLSGRNFGCGSSREHAVWGIYDYGFQVVISSFFADLFKENALNNGLLVVEISEYFLKKLFDIIINQPSTNVRVNLIEQVVTIVETGEFEKFYIHPYKKNCFINGSDDIDFLVSLKEKIKSFEKRRLFFNF
ncbi:3-isopropylmalate dehydratase small subunit [Blattabacterium cuenoti]|uniref:3-isopropylmalate dehydratase small subunit n=1 Tax=Blattabacterium cuenoti TaxID=1653831 RepID=UPI00163BDF0F|nr:3-isopropylmalate dehydratase small subunit [Blattabacterium cuenoti]